MLARIVSERFQKEREERKEKLLLMLKQLSQRLSDEEKQFTYVFGSLVWGKLHARSDLDLAVDDRELDGETAWELVCKILSAVEEVADVFATPDEFEEAVDVVLLSELPDTLRERILKEGVKLCAVKRLTKKTVETHEAIVEDLKRFMTFLKKLAETNLNTEEQGNRKRKPLQP